MQKRSTFERPVYWNDVLDYCENKQTPLPDIQPNFSVYKIEEIVYKSVLFIRPNIGSVCYIPEKIRISTPTIREEDITRLEEIGSGQYGIVYRALFRHHNVAAKVLSLKHAQLDDEEIEKVKLEAEILR